VRGLCILSATYLVSVGDDKLLKIWDLKTGRCLKTIEAHEHFVTCVRSSAGVLVTGSVDQTVKVWK
jgi:platelet-activating factor acetylhydrolase IB subunit alpha